MTAKQNEYREEIQETGIIGKNGEKLEFSRVEAAQGTEYIQAVAETKEDTPRRAVIHFGSETKVLDAGRVEDIFDEVQQMRPTPKLVVIAAYQFDPEATKIIEETKWPDLQVFAVQMNTDLMTKDLKKKRASNEAAEKVSIHFINRYRCHTLASVPIFLYNRSREPTINQK